MRREGIPLVSGAPAQGSSKPLDTSFGLIGPALAVLDPAKFRDFFRVKNRWGSRTVPGSRSHRMAAALAPGALPAPAAASADAGPALSLDAGADRHAISQDIYGLNYADPTLAQQIGLPVERWGGNTTDTYNWRLHSYNLGQDWYHENIADCWSEAAGYCNGGQ